MKRGVLMAMLLVGGCGQIVAPPAPPSPLHVEVTSDRDRHPSIYYAMPDIPLPLSAAEQSAREQRERLRYWQDVQSIIDGTAKGFHDVTANCDRIRYPSGNVSGCVMY